MGYAEGVCWYETPNPSRPASEARPSTEVGPVALECLLMHAQRSCWHRT